MPPPPRQPVLVGLLAGFLGLVLLYSLAGLGRALDFDAGRYPKLAIALVVFGIVGYVVGAAVRKTGHREAGRLAGTAFGAALVGIAVAGLGWSVFERVRFIEIAMLWFYSALPIIFGVAVGLYSGGERRPER